MSDTEKCPGVGFHARDPHGNPCNACPVCGRWCKLTKFGRVPFHKRPVGFVNTPAWFRKVTSG